jgi:hypothetical protein
MNVYDIIYSTMVTIPGQVFNFSVLLNGSVAGLAADMATLP